MLANAWVLALGHQVDGLLARGPRKLGDVAPERTQLGDQVRSLAGAAPWISRTRRRSTRAWSSASRSWKSRCSSQRAPSRFQQSASGHAAMSTPPAPARTRYSTTDVWRLPAQVTG
jgi:hypothetical protein